MGSHSVTCHPAEVTFPPYLESAETATTFRRRRSMQSGAWSYRCRQLIRNSAAAAAAVTRCSADPGSESSPTADRAACPGRVARSFCRRRRRSLTAINRRRAGQAGTLPPGGGTRRGLALDPGPSGHRPSPPQKKTTILDICPSYDKGLELWGEGLGLGLGDRVRV